MLVYTPKALDGRHGVNFLDVCLVLVQRGIVNGLVQPERPGRLEGHALALLPIEVVDCLRRHLARRKGHDGGVVAAHVPGDGHGLGGRRSHGTSKMILAVHVYYATCAGRRRALLS